MASRIYKVDQNKKLKSESTSGKATVDEENYIVWENNETQNILVSNSVRFKAYDIKYNVHIKIKNNKTLIIVENVFGGIMVYLKKSLIHQLADLKTKIIPLL